MGKSVSKPSVGSVHIPGKRTFAKIAASQVCTRHCLHASIMQKTALWSPCDLMLQLYAEQAVTNNLVSKLLL